MSNKRNLKGKSRPSKNKAGRNVIRKDLQAGAHKAKKDDDFFKFKTIVDKLRSM